MSRVLKNSRVMQCTVDQKSKFFSKLGSNGLWTKNHNFVQNMDIDFAQQMRENLKILQHDKVKVPCKC